MVRPYPVGPFFEQMDLSRLSFETSVPGAWVFLEVEVSVAGTEAYLASVLVVRRPAAPPRRKILWALQRPPLFWPIRELFRLQRDFSFQ